MYACEMEYGGMGYDRMENNRTERGEIRYRGTEQEIIGKTEVKLNRSCPYESPVIDDVIRRISLVKDTMPVIFLVTEDRNLIEKIFDQSGCFNLYRQTEREGRTVCEEVFTFREALYSREDHGNKGNIIRYTNPGTLNPRAYRMDSYHGPFYYFCRDFHLLYPDAYSRDTYIRDFIDASEQNPFQIANLLISSPKKLIPRGLEAYIELIDVPMIGMYEIRRLMEEYGAAADGPEDRFLANLRGLNERQIRSILSMVRSRFGRVSAAGSEQEEDEKGKQAEALNDYCNQLILREKESMVKKDGTISFVQAVNPPVGGLDGVLEWIEEKKKYLRDPAAARARGERFPKGILVAGLPGSGKSLLAKKVAAELSLPLIRFHLGMILGGLVGESEANLDRALKLAEAVSPCVVWIDEIEKELGGTQGKGETDGGVGNRILARLLNWMQENDRQCLLFATANRVQNLPRELTRAGRISKKFYTFLPMHEECVAILRQIVRREGEENPGLFRQRFIDEELREFGDAVFDYAAEFEHKFYTGADIENLVREALSELYQEGYLEPVGRELFQEKLLEQVVYTKPFGETNTAETAEYWLALKEGRFECASVGRRTALGKRPVLLEFDDLAEDEEGFYWKDDMTDSGSEIAADEAMGPAVCHPYDIYMKKAMKRQILIAANRRKKTQH